MRLATLLLPLAALFALALPAVADELPPTSEFFDEYDQNADGKVTAEEFRGASEIFRLLDKNGDGAVSPDELGLPAEYKPKPKKRAAPGGPTPRADGAARARERFRAQLAKLDTDKDGRVSKAEWQGAENVFDRFDRNKDGFLDAQDAPRAAGRGDRAPKGERAKKGAKKGDRAAGAEAMVERAKGQFERLDKNTDGKLTADELPNAGLLNVADADKDGAVTLEEFVAFVRKRADGGRDAKGARGDRRRGRFNAGMLRRWDGNDDGKVSREEFPGRDEAFQRFDADKDGYLTPADLDAARKPDAGKQKDAAPAPPVTQKPGSVIDAQDTDGDGKLHRGEFKGTAEAWRALDKNGDGWVTADELR